MKRIRTTLSAMLVTALLVGPAAGATAQGGPTEFTARWAFGSAMPSGEAVAEDGITKWRGQVWQPRTRTEATDPRFRGEITNSWNHDDYPDGSKIGSVTFTVRNDDGAWIMRPALALEFPGDQWWPLFGAIFDGEGAYDGLLALVNIETADSGFDLRGYIVDEDSLPDLEAYRP